MKALIISRGRFVEGLGDPAEDALFAHTTVGAAVDAACMANGIQPVRLKPGDAVPLVAGERALVLPADLFITSTLVQAFAASPGDGVMRLALRRTPAVDYALPLQDVQLLPLDDNERCQEGGALAAQERRATEKALFDAYLCGAEDVGATVTDGVFDRLRERARPVVVGKKELATVVRLPLLPMQSAEGAPTMLFPFTSSIAVGIRHWVHVLWLNHLAPGILLNISMRQNKLGTLVKAISGMSFKREKLLERISVIHPTARVHPTAHVEGSVVGPGAVIGARASVRQSIIAEGAEVGEHATVLSSTVGARVYITPRTFLVWCAIYPDSVVGNYKLQVSLVGRGAHVNAWAGLIDAKFQGAVRVELDGKLVSTERSFLGSCIGHGAQVAAKVLVHPGRVIPNGTVVVMRPDEVISDIPADMKPGVPMVRDAGTLKPLAAMKSGAG